LTDTADEYDDFIYRATEHENGTLDGDNLDEIPY